MDSFVQFSTFPGQVVYAIKNYSLPFTSQTAILSSNQKFETT